MLMLLFRYSSLPKRSARVLVVLCFPDIYGHVSTANPRKK